MTLSRREQDQPLCHAPLDNRLAAGAVCILDAGHRSPTHFGQGRDGRYRNWGAS